MHIDSVKQLPVKEQWLYWIKERESIRCRRQCGGTKPWTDDTILQRYRFCNVRRMDDKVSQWLHNHWYQPYYNHPNMLPAVALARFINQPATLEAIGFPAKWDPKHIKQVVRKLQRQGETVYNAAYMVRGNDGCDKIQAVLDYYIKPLLKLTPALVLNSMEATHAVLLESYGLGSFMAGQIVADLRWAVRGSWEDKHRWAPIGPGSKKGMNLFMGRPSGAPLSQSQFLEELQEAMELAHQQIPKKTLLVMEYMEAHDFQNCFCEFSKYSKALYGQGRPKQLYPGV